MERSLQGTLRGRVPSEAVMKVADLMTGEVASANVGETCDAAARIMWERDVGSVPIVDASGRLVGMVTDRDLLLVAYQEKKRLDELALESTMTGGVIAGRLDDEVQDIEALMQTNQIRRIPIVDDDARLVGIVAIADLARARGAQAAQTVEVVSQPTG